MDLVGSRNFLVSLQTHILNRRRNLLKDISPYQQALVVKALVVKGDFEISKKNLHPPHAPYGGMFLEVKNPKNRTPKVVFHPNRIFKSHHFVVQILIHLYIHSSRQTIGPRDTSVRDITKNWWLLKKKFGWKTTFGLGFLKFFTSKNMPRTWTYAGCKNFFLPTYKPQHDISVNR